MTRALSIAIVAHPSRARMARRLSRQLGDAPIAMDTDGIGAGKNHDRALILADQTEAEWALIVEEDALPIPDFLTHAEAALASAPTPIASLYCGKSRPPQYQARIARALTTDPHWLLAPTLLHCVCVAIRQDVVTPLLTAIETVRLDADQRIGRGAQRIGIRQIAHSNPSLVQHQDGPTLIAHRDGQPRRTPRVAWAVGSRERWTTEAVPL